MQVAKQSQFGERLKQLREEAGLSISELARQSEVSKQAISKIESGDRDPNWNTVVKLCRALGVSVSEFDTGEDPREQEDTQTKEQSPTKKPKK